MLRGTCECTYMPKKLDKKNEITLYVGKIKLIIVFVEIVSNFWFV